MATLRGHNLQNTLLTMQLLQSTKGMSSELKEREGWIINLIEIHYFKNDDNSKTEATDFLFSFPLSN